MKTLKRLLFFSTLLFLLSCGNREEPVAEAVVPTTPLPQNRILKYVGSPYYAPGVGLTTQNGQVITRNGGDVVYVNGKIDKIFLADPSSTFFRFSYENGHLKEIRSEFLLINGTYSFGETVRLFYTNDKLTRVVKIHSYTTDAYQNDTARPSTIFDYTYDGDNVATVSMYNGNYSMAGGASLTYELYKITYQYDNPYKNPYGTLPKELQVFNAFFGGPYGGNGMDNCHLTSKNPVTKITVVQNASTLATHSFVYEADAAGYPVNFRPYQSDIKQIFLYDTW